MTTRTVNPAANKRGEWGVSLLGALIAVAIVGIIAASVSSLMGNAFKAQARVEERGDLEAIRRMLLNATSCDKTLLNGTCAPGSFVALQRLAGENVETLVSADMPTYFGKIAVRAECNATGNGVILRATRLRVGATLTTTNPDQFRPEALTKRIITWADDDSLLFPVGIEICSQKQRGLACTHRWAQGNLPYGNATVSCQAQEQLVSCTANTTPGGDTMCSWGWDPTTQVCGAWCNSATNVGQDYRVDAMCCRVTM